MHARVTGWATVITCGCWLTITANAQDMSRARTIAGVGGRIIGQAMVCGVSRDRLEQTGARVMDRMTAAAADANERSYVIDLYMQASLAGALKQKEGTGDPCPEVHDAFDGLERQLSPG